MWFNVLKNEERRAAYQHFLNALGLGPDNDRLDTSKLGEIEEYPKDDRPITALTIRFGGQINSYVLFYSLSADIFNLIISNKHYEPHEDFVFNLFKEEYPEAHATIQRMFLEKEQEIKDKEAAKAQNLKYQRYIKDGYDISDYDITIRTRVFTSLRDEVLELLLESRKYLRSKSPTMNVLRMPMISERIDRFTADLESTNRNTSLAELIRNIHRIFNHDNSVPNLIYTGTLEDYYLDLIEHLQNKGLVTLKKGMLLLIAMRDEYDSLEGLFG